MGGGREVRESGLALLMESTDVKRAGVSRINKIPNVESSKSPYMSGLYPLHFQIGKWKRPRKDSRSYRTPEAGQGQTNFYFCAPNVWLRAWFRVGTEVNACGTNEGCLVSWFFEQE